MFYSNIKNKISFLKDGNIKKIFISQLLISIGDGIWLISLPLLILEITSNKVYVGVVSVFEMIPIVLSFIIGPYVDRKEPKKLMILSITIKVISFLVLLTLIIYNSVNIILLCIFAFILSSTVAVYNPVKVSLLPRIIATEYLDKALSFLNILDIGSLIIGKMSAGIIISTLSYNYILIIEVCIFLSSVLILFFLSKIKNVYYNNDNDNDRYFKVLKARLGEIYNNPLWKYIIINFMLINILVTGLISIISPIFAYENFPKSYSLVYSLMFSTFQIGIVLGNGIVFLKGSKDNIFLSYFRIIIIVTILAITFSFNFYEVNVLILLFMGIFLSIIDVQTILYFQKTINPKQYGSIFSIIFSVIKLGDPISSGIYTVLLLILAPNYVIVALSSSILLFVILYRAINKNIRRAMK